MSNKYDVLHQKLLRTNQESVRLQILHRFPYHYLCLGNDTFHNRTWDKSSFEELLINDVEERYVEPVTLYHSENVQDIINSPANCDTRTRWLIQTDHKTWSTVSAGIVQRVQLDTDEPLEAVIQTKNRYSHSYIIYDSLPAGWTYVDMISQPDRQGFQPVDTSLIGYFGLVSKGWGMGLSCTDMNYYQLSEGRLVYCFAISQQYDQWLPHLCAESYASINATGTARLKNDSTIEIKHRISFSLTSKDDETRILFQHKKNTAFNYVRTAPDSIFRPDQNVTGLATASTYYHPEINIMNELCSLKNSGSGGQRFYLKNLVCDIEFYR